MQAHDNPETQFLGDDHANFFSTESEISDAFNRIQIAWLQYEDCQVNMPYDEAVQILKKIESSVIQHGLFSPNEGVEEIATENLKYLLLPFYLADIFGRTQENRKASLSLSKLYYDEFIKLCNHYELVTKEQRRQWKSAFDNENYEPSRDDKILGFKEKKELENQIKNIEKIKDEDNRRQILLLNIRMKILKAIEDIRFIHLENQMQAHKDKLAAEKLQNPGMQEPKFEPKKMQVWHVPKAEKNPQQPYLMANHDHGCFKCDPMYNMKVKEDIKAKVFTSTNTPTMSLDEFADQAMKMFGDMEKNQKDAAEFRAREEAKDQDKDDIVDKKRLEESAWDDWKDENEKGAGNKKR